MDWRTPTAMLIFASSLTGCATKGTNPLSGFFAARELAEPGADPSSGSAELPGSSDRMANIPARKMQPVQMASGQSKPPATSMASYTAQPALVVLNSEKQFSSLMQSSRGPVVLDFFTTWCGPCKSQSKILHEMESVAQEKGATIIKVDAEKFPKIAEQFKVKAYPTLVAVKNGAVAQRQVGVADPKMLEQWFSL
ncbi:MAG: thioredoxin family protein [Aureliella sp.]